MNTRFLRLLALVLGLIACGNITELTESVKDETQPAETLGQDEVQTKDTIVYAQSPERAGGMPVLHQMLPRHRKVQAAAAPVPGGQQRPLGGCHEVY